MAAQRETPREGGWGGRGMPGPTLGFQLSSPARGDHGQAIFPEAGSPTTRLSNLAPLVLTL